MLKERGKDTKAVGWEPPGGVAIEKDDVETPNAIQQLACIKAYTLDRRWPLPICESNPNDSAIQRQQRGKTRNDCLKPLRGC